MQVGDGGDEAAGGGEDSEHGRSTLGDEAWDVEESDQEQDKGAEGSRGNWAPHQRSAEACGSATEDANNAHPGRLAWGRKKCGGRCDTKKRPPLVALLLEPVSPG